MDSPSLTVLKNDEFSGDCSAADANPQSVVASTYPARTGGSRQTVGPATFRIASLDITRVFAIGFVMLIHSHPVGEWLQNPVVFLLKNFIAAGAVPIFFLMSGYLGAPELESESLTGPEYFRKKWRSLVVPYLFWSSVVVILVLPGTGTILQRRTGILVDYRRAYRNWTVTGGLSTLVFA